MPLLLLLLLLFLLLVFLLVLVLLLLPMLTLLLLLLTFPMLLLFLAPPLPPITGVVVAAAAISCPRLPTPRLTPWCPEFDHGLTSDGGQVRLAELKARARAEEPPYVSSRPDVQAVDGPRRDANSHVSPGGDCRVGVDVMVVVMVVVVAAVTMVVVVVMAKALAVHGRSK